MAISASATYVEMADRNGVPWNLELEPNGDGTFKIASVGGIARVDRGDQYTALTDGTATTIVTADADNKLDLYGLIISNTSAAAVDVLIEDGTTDRGTITVPADDVRGFTLPPGAGLKQAAVNTAWKATGAAGVNITALYTKAGA